MNPYQLIIFDFDGTLAMTHQAIVSCMIQTFQTFDLTPPPEAEMQATIGINLSEAFKLLHPAIADDQIPTWVETYRSYYRTEGERQLGLFPNTQTVLHSAVAAGLTLSVLSNKHIYFIDLFLKKLEIHHLFQLVIGDDGTIKKKPDPSIFQTIIKPKFPDLQNHQILIVGDTAVDLLFAKNAGIDACWVTYGYGDRAQCLALKPQYIIHDLSELLPIVVPF